MNLVLFEDASASEGTDLDYTQLIYEYLSSQDVISGSRQEEIYTSYTEKLDVLETDLQNIHTLLDWNVALLVLLIVLFLMKSIRSWGYKTTGGLKDVF